MSLLSIIIAIVVVGIVLYVINRWVPMDQNIKNILNVVVIIVLVIWLLKAFGVFGYLSQVHV